MKIAIIGQKGIPSRAGGVEIHVEEIASRLAKRGHNITAYCRKSYCDKNLNKYRGINIKYIKSINSKHLDAITYTLLSTIDAIRNDFDVIQYHALGPSLLAFIPRILGKKVVCTVHGLDWKREKWGRVAKTFLKIGEVACVKFPNKTISVSKSLAEYYKSKYMTNIEYIPNGIDKKNKLSANKIKTLYNINENEYILFLARLVPEKGAHYLIEAFNKIKTNKKLLIAGGSSHSNNYVNKLRDLAKNNSNIIFTDFVKGEILDELFTNAYFYVLPSEIEGLPISLLEAMAYGQCCLVSDIRENLDVIEDKAVVFKNKDVLDLEKKLKYLVDNPKIVEEYKSISEEYILNKYVWENIAIETEEVFKSL